jgi:hypothetical protein
MFFMVGLIALTLAITVAAIFGLQHYPEAILRCPLLADADISTRPLR